MNRTFSFKWVFFSMLLFVVVELALGVSVGELVAGRFASLNLKFLIQGTLNLASYFLGE